MKMRLNRLLVLAAILSISGIQTLASESTPIPKPIPVAYCYGSGSCCQGSDSPSTVVCCTPDQPVSEGGTTTTTTTLSCTSQGNYSTCSGTQACYFSAEHTAVNADGRCCDDLGGVTCGAGSDAQVTVSCCVDDACYDLPSACCLMSGGTPGATGSACTGTIGACCNGDASTETDGACCSGTWLGDGTVCDPDPVNGNDSDGDTVCDPCDNCVHAVNVEQNDGDGDGVGDACDNCSDDINPACSDPNGCDCNGNGVTTDWEDAWEGEQCDRDFDGIGDICDNCPDVANAVQTDTDLDGYGDACDLCPNDPVTTIEDTDGDGVGDTCDNCPDTPNNDQLDSDTDGLGDECDDCEFDPDNDIDGDGKCGDVDNCPTIVNPDQENCDEWSGDLDGDACDDDIDGDGILNDDDTCDFTTQFLILNDIYVPGYYIVRMPGHSLYGNSRFDVSGDCDVDQQDIDMVTSGSNTGVSCVDGDSSAHSPNLCP